ncbi:uncharacterized protein K444DRAFT_356879 [Hyaloscypha bicolor E]|uniref:Uncharacterized protein n=1 Tax=Hyaloscypha bicolor E TaxID=1095630 RepID=A0A2J6TFQ4_9HELO|nr:uncharacterized protein K444DRAFT_356879 [Hyaloscypha bicolor E]PMD61849.1 hypothetical protein K444DRAFT_356879 [Hyaloscypha bicolor E]
MSIVPSAPSELPPFFPWTVEFASKGYRILSPGQRFSFCSLLSVLFSVSRKQASKADPLARFRRRKPSDRCACTKGVDIESNQPIRHRNSPTPQFYSWPSSLVVKIPGNKILVGYTSPENTLPAVGLGRSNSLCIALIYLTIGGNLLKQLAAEIFTKRSPSLLLLQECIFIGTTAR